MPYSEETVDSVIYTELTAEELRSEACWFVVLSDKTRVYSKTNRRSWLELKQYLSGHDYLKIIAMYVQFRDNTIEIATGNRDYFFSHAAIAYAGCPTQEQYLAGYRVENIVHVKRYVVPELILIEEETRMLDDPTVKKGLIRENNYSC